MTIKRHQSIDKEDRSLALQTIRTGICFSMCDNSGTDPAGPHGQEHSNNSAEGHLTEDDKNEI